MSNPIIPPTVPRLVKPTLDTLFHIDYAWWKKQNITLNVELRTHLCPEHQEVFREHFDTETIDWVDPKTAEVTQVDGLQHVLQVHCCKLPNYINKHLSLVDAVFRVFLSNGNQPLTCQDLSRLIDRPAAKILSTLSGLRVYKGIRPQPKS